MDVLNVLLAFLLVSSVGCNFFEFEQTYVNKNDIKKKIRFTTFTSCLMTCMSDMHCDMIGFEHDPITMNNVHCLSIKLNDTAPNEANDMKEGDDLLLHVLKDPNAPVKKKTAAKKEPATTKKTKATTAPPTTSQSPTTAGPKTWRDDNRCGLKFRLLNGKSSECNPKSKKPCCSSKGYCGITAAHCSCHGCKDYRPVQYAVIELGACESVTENNCLSIVKQKGFKVMKKTTDKSVAPIGCYHHGKNNYIVYNNATTSAASCTPERICFCKKEPTTSQPPTTAESTTSQPPKTVEELAKLAAGTWFLHVILINQKSTFTISSEGLISAVGIGRTATAIPSDNQEVFPSAQGWFKVNNLYEDDSWDYFRLTEDGKIEVRHYDSSGKYICNAAYKLTKNNCWGYNATKVSAEPTTSPKTVEPTTSQSPTTAEPTTSQSPTTAGLTGTWNVRFEEGSTTTYKISEDGRVEVLKASFSSPIKHSTLEVSNARKYPTSKGWRKVAIHRDNVYIYIRRVTGATVEVVYISATGREVKGTGTLETL